MRHYATGVVISVLGALAACGTSPEDMREIRDGQRELRTKLEEIQKKVDQIASRPAAPAGGAAAADPNRVYNIPIGDSPVKGPATAKVTIAEFSDFQCPFCSQVPPTIYEVLKAYPNDVKFVFKQFPLVRIHPQATPAAKASLAAHKQGKFWEMHDKLFANQKQLDNESLKKYAQELGLDMAKFEADMNSPEIAKQVEDEMKLASTNQVTGTPTLFVNGRKVANRTVDGLKGMIDEALKKG
jgi:protein-disulfide isomerase